MYLRLCLYVQTKQRTHTHTHAREDGKAICRQKLIRVCMWDKEAAFMVYGNHPPPTPSLPPTCIITRTYSHDWWNIRLWNPSCFCYHPHFHLSPILPFLSIFFCLVSPLCLTKYLSSALQLPKMFGICTNKKLHTHSTGCILKAHVRAHTHTHTCYRHHFSLSNSMHERCMRTAASEEEYEMRWKEK